MKKALSMLLCVTTAAAMGFGLSGCGEDKTTDNGDTLVWYTFGNKPDDLEEVLSKANEIIEPEIGMKLDMQYIDSASYAEKMKLKMASGEAYDLAFTGYTNDYHTAVALGGLYDITDLIKEVGLDEAIPQFYFDAATVKGKIYGIPNIQVVSNPVCIYIDKTLNDSINVDMEAIQEAACNAKTFEDIQKYSLLLDDLFAQVHEARPDLHVYDPYYNLITVPRWEGLNDFVSVLRDGSSTELELNIDTEDWKYSVDKLREWYTKGYIRNDIASVGTGTSSDEELRQIAVVATTWKPGQDAYVTKQRNDIPVYALLSKPYVGRTNPLSTMTSVGANTKHPKEAVEFLKLINTNEELFNIISWGIEGKHYTLNDNGHITEIANSGYSNHGKNAWKYGNQFLGYMLDDQEDGVWEETEKMNNEAIKSPILGFVPDTDPITNELANLTNINAEYKAKREYGTIDPSEWMDDYLKRLDQAGIQKVKDTIQKQYDEFLESK